MGKIDVKRADTPLDAKHFPVPTGGWSCQMRAVPDALVATSTLPDLVQPCGVFDAKGAYVHEAVLWRGRALMVEPETRPEPAETLPGRWLWGGVLLNHFGHFLVESLGRLWGLDAAKSLDGIVFISKRDSEEEGEELDISQMHQRFFALLGIDLPIRILTRPTRIEHLEVPGQGFGIGALASGTAAFRAYMHQHFARDIAPQGGEKLYISRSALSATRGGILAETRIEEALAAQGYDIFHPQKHTLEEQIARYKAARLVIALDGSALHMFAMVGRPDQVVAIIKRRDSGATDSIIAHLSHFCGRAPEVVDVIKNDWVRSDRKKADRMSVGELDFTALSKELVKLGLVTPSFEIPALSERQAERAILKVERDLRRRNLTFRPVPRGVDPASVPLPDRIVPPRRELREAKKASRALSLDLPRSDRQARRMGTKARLDTAAE